MQGMLFMSKEKKPKKQIKQIKQPKVENDKYKQFTLSLTDSEREVLTDFFGRLNLHISLNRKFRQAMVDDFEKAFMYYHSAGVPVAKAAELMAPEKMGGFYARPAALWFKLDVAAKIFPLSMHNNRMSVFRLSVYLKENVIPELLQIALTFTIKRFPLFATTVKKGFFWHYLDSAKRRFSIDEETNVPCRPLDISLTDSQSFRVLYYQNRISLEFFHILTDATGGMVFLKTLTAEYLRLTGVDIPSSGGIPDINDAPAAHELEDGFSKVDKAEKAYGLLDKQATQMSGSLSKIKPCRILHFKIDAAKLKEVSKAKGGTVTAYILSLMFAASKSAIDGEGGSINIQVPVNMRKFYNTETLRNFALYCNVRLQVAEVTKPEDILPEMQNQLVEKGSKTAMDSTAKASLKLFNALSFIPLFIKNPVARLVYGYLGEKTWTNTLSNLGVVTLPPEMEKHIECFDFVLGTGVTNRAYCSMVTFGNTAMLSISKLTKDPTFEEVMFSLLDKDGLTPEVEGSDLYEG